MTSLGVSPSSFEELELCQRSSFYREFDPLTLYEIVRFASIPAFLHIRQRFQPASFLPDGGLQLRAPRARVSPVFEARQTPLPCSLLRVRTVWCTNHSTESH
jgi:hypothetical protein